MDGNWQWSSSREQLVRSDYWDPGQQLPQSTQVYGHNEFLPAPSHNSFDAIHRPLDPPPSLPGFQLRDDDGLDEFDRQLLGMSELPAAHPQSARRLTLSQAQPTMRRASQPMDHAHSYSHSMFIPDHQQPAPGYSLLSPHQRVPATAAIANREPVHRHRALHPGLQQDTPHLNSALFVPSYVSAEAEDPVTPTPGRSPSDCDSPSPSAGASLRKQSRTHGLSQRKTPSMSSQERPSPDSATALPPRPPVVNGIQLISPRQALPDNLGFRSIFPYEVFNAVQSKCFDSVYNSSDNLVVSAPTGSGKTAILELAICRIVANRGQDNIKIVYQAPTKALCAEKARDWTEKFGPLQLKCAELTGDTSQTELRRVGSASIIVTTPEKWDSITRKWHDHQKLLRLVGLFLIDEVHILKDTRGATLEAVVSRMKSIGNNVRFVALSATVPNAGDIATWLGRDHQNQHLPARLETFGEEFRPVKLERHVFGYEKRTNDHVFDRFLDSKLPTLLTKHTDGKPILIFCFTRKSCESTAAKLAELWASLPDGKQPWHQPPKQIRVLNRDLQEIVQAGVAFHHAGLAADDRQAVEQAFLKGELSVICCTSTLAVGVNLPCHTVVLKGTVTYQNDAIHELSDLEVMQMLGRAGRPQFDTSANALILTSSDQKERYLKMVTGEEILESTLHLNLIEHLNSEVGLRTITDMESAKKWLAGTYLSVRLRQNPTYYRLAEATPAAKDTDSILEEICERDVKLLQDHNIITRDAVFRQTAYGGAMSKYMVEFSTMKLLLELPPALKMEQLLNALSKASEFREFKFKPADGPIFREVNRSPFILYPIEENVSKTWHKISLVVQLHLGGADYPDSSESQKHRNQLRLEKKGIFERLQRLVRCVAECKGYDCDSVSTKTALELARSLAANAWEGRPSELLQIPNVGPVYMRKLISQGVKTVKELVEKNHGELERLLSRKPPAGKIMSDALKNFPLLGLDLSIPNRKHMSVSGQAVSVPVVATLRCLNQAGPPTWNNKVPSVTFVAETTAGTLVYFWKESLRKIKNDTGLQLQFSADITALDQQIRCYFSCEEIVGTIVTKTLDHNIPSSAFKQQSQRVEVTKEPMTGYHGDSTGRNAPVLQSTDGSLSQDYLDDADSVEAAAALLDIDDSAALQDETRKPQSQSVESDYTDGDFPMIDDILKLISPRPSPPPPQPKAPGTGYNSDESRANDMGKDPVKLPNGRYQCNHACSGGALTKSGKVCTHRCCLEGLDKPRKLKPRTAETKKRKTEGPVDDNGMKESSGNSTRPKAKKPRVSQNSTSAPDSSGTPWKPTFEPTKVSDTDATHQAIRDSIELECLDLSNIDDDDDLLPDLSSLASSKRNGQIFGATNAGATSTSKDSGHQASPPARSQSSPTEDYMPSAPPAVTTDYGHLDDGFDSFDDDFEVRFTNMVNGGLGEPSNTVAKPMANSKESIRAGGAFRSGAEDAMLFAGVTPSALSRKSSEAKHTMSTLSPRSYKTALQEASKLCDVDSQVSSSYKDRRETSPCEGFDPFYDTRAGLADTTTPAQSSLESSFESSLAPRSPDDLLDGGDGGQGSERSIDATFSSSMVPAKQDGEEPAWVQEFDQEFIDSFRGFVNFV